jgi:putative two-component system response regulator
MSRILVIDDEPAIRGLMVEILERADHETLSAETPERALQLLDDEKLSLVLSDIVLPGLTGFELLEEVRTRRPSLPVVLVTGGGTYDHLTEALAHGADGFVMKPFTQEELRAAVDTALARARRSERDVRQRLLVPTLAAALANAIEARDASMHGHCERIAALATRLAQEIGLPRADVETVRLGAVLHDIGKIGIPDRVLLKEGELTREEIELMQTHPVIGDRLIASVDFLSGIGPIVRHHHERWDGRGYPDGLAGDAIPLHARIVMLSDAIEAMSGKRLYRQPLSTEELTAELQRCRGEQWDPRLVDVALDLIEQGEVVFGPDGLEVRAEHELSALEAAS